MIKLRLAVSKLAAQNQNVLKFACQGVSNFAFFSGDYNTKGRKLSILVVSDSESIDLRVDIFLANNLKISRNQVTNLITNSQVKINNKIATKASIKLNLNDKIEVKFVEQKMDSVDFDVNFDVPIIYEDDDLLVLNKPANLVIHPAPSVKEATLVEWLGKKGFLLSTLSGESRAGIVHRLDCGTSGAIVVAKNNATHAALSHQLSDKSMGRIYLAITDLALKQNCVIDRPIGRNNQNRLKKAIAMNGRVAKSAFANLLFNENKSGANLIAAKLFTGRTHQIRVHLSSINRHILGDSLYGFKSENGRIARVMLHAFGIYFIHPRSGKRVTFVAPIWDDFMEILEKNFSKETIDEKIDFKGLDVLFSTCNEWLYIT